MKQLRSLSLLVLFLFTQVVNGQTVSIRTAPRLQGNYYNLPPQTAINTMLLSRLPKNWTVPANRYLLWQGPVMASPTERLKLFTNGGITHSMIPDATNPMNLPSSKRGNFPGGGGTHSLALSIAAELPDGDPKKASLLEYGNGTMVDGERKYYVDDNAAAWRLLGRRSFESSVGANNGVAPSMWGTDLEDQVDKPGFPGAHISFVTYVYEGAKQAIANLGLTGSVKLFTYGAAALTQAINHTNNRQDADIYMRLPGEYWKDGAGNFAINTSVTQVFREGAFIGYDKYLRSVWDDTSVWQKNSDGTIKTDGNGMPLYHVGKKMVTNYGHTFETYTYEAQSSVDQLYSEMDKILTEWRWLCNTPITGYIGNFVNMPFPRGTYDIRPGLANIRLLSYIRDNTEMLQHYNPDLPPSGNFDPWYSTPEMGIEAANTRALNHRSLEMTVLARTMLNHLLYVFGNPGNYADWQQGVSNQHAFDFRGTGGIQNYAIKQRFGQFETILKASHRGRNFPELFKVMDASKAVFILPWRFVLAGNTGTIAESQASKPIFWGVKEQGGRRMWAMWCLPAQDIGNAAMNRNLTMWIELPNGTKSPSYVMSCADRVTGFDQFLLPAGFENATAEDFRFRFVGLLGGTYFRTGNYNVSVTGTPTVPTAATSTLTTYTLPTNAQ